MLSKVHSDYSKAHHGYPGKQRCYTINYFQNSICQQKNKPQQIMYFCLGSDDSHHLHNSRLQHLKKIPFEKTLKFSKIFFPHQNVH